MLPEARQEVLIIPRMNGADRSPIITQTVVDLRERSRSTSKFGGAIFLTMATLKPYIVRLKGQFRFVALSID